LTISAVLISATAIFNTPYLRTLELSPKLCRALITIKFKKAL
jgi:hypothetical protein